MTPNHHWAHLLTTNWDIGGLGEIALQGGGLSQADVYVVLTVIVLSVVYLRSRGLT